MWRWKNLKALHRSRHKKFNCHLFLHVHAIEGLPSDLDGQSLRINWERNGRLLRTRPAVVSNGCANFEETLSYKSSIHANQNQNHHTISYDSKFFKIYVSTVGVPGHDTGIQWVDFSRFLPLTLEELEEKGSGKFTESLNLTGNAKGATLMVSHVYSLMGHHHSIDTNVNMTVFHLLNDANCVVSCGASSAMVSDLGSASSSSDDPVVSQETLTQSARTLGSLIEYTHDEIEDCEEFSDNVKNEILVCQETKPDDDDDDDVNDCVLKEILDAAENEEQKYLLTKVEEEDEPNLPLATQTDEQQGNVNNSLNDKAFSSSSSPWAFRKAKSESELILQVSIPVVLPIAMGSSIMEILEHWASVGQHQMYSQLNLLMPLQDFNRKKMDDDSERSSVLNQKPGDEVDSDFVSIEDLAPLAMEKIEALSFVGLKIQSGNSEEEAPSTIRPQLIGGKPTFLNKEDDSEEEPDTQMNDVNQLINLSITLDEWMKLDSGNFSHELNLQTSKIIAAHLDEDEGFVGETGGVLGNIFTIATRVQLRNPHHEFETVGEPMIALIQVERAFIDLKPRVSNTISDTENKPSLSGDDIPLFKIIEVHVAGFVTNVASQMHDHDHVHVESRVWSISGHVYGPGAHWKEVATQTSHIRNPDVAFST